MTDRARLGVKDYPIAEKRPDIVRTRSGRALDTVTIESLSTGETGMSDLRITPEALRFQSEIADAAGRPTLGRNFVRASELVDVPQEEIFRIYELLRPGRAKSKQELLDAAAVLRDQFGAARMAEFVGEAAEIYERRGLFRFRF